MQIHATCFECHEDVTRETEDVTAWVLAPERGFYGFQCPLCGGYSRKAISPTVFHALCEAQVEFVCVDRPTEIDDEQRRIAVPITSDDLIDFHLALEEPDWIDRVYRRA